MSGPVATVFHVKNNQGTTQPAHGLLKTVARQRTNPISTIVTMFLRTVALEPYITILVRKYFPLSKNESLHDDFMLSFPNCLNKRIPGNIASKPQGWRPKILCTCGW